jgi:hypothetical protein
MTGKLLYGLARRKLLAAAIAVAALLFAASVAVPGVRRPLRLERRQRAQDRQAGAQDREARGPALQEGAEQGQERSERHQRPERPERSARKDRSDRPRRNGSGIRGRQLLRPFFRGLEDERLHRGHATVDRPLLPGCTGPEPEHDAGICNDRLGADGRTAGQRDRHERSRRGSELSGNRPHGAHGAVRRRWRCFERCRGQRRRLRSPRSVMTIDRVFDTR